MNLRNGRMPSAGVSGLPCFLICETGIARDCCSDLIGERGVALHNMFALQFDRAHGTDNASRPFAVWLDFNDFAIRRFVVVHAPMIWETPCRVNGTTVLVDKASEIRGIRSLGARRTTGE